MLLEEKTMTPTDIISALAAYGVSRKLGLLDPVPLDHA